MKTWGDDLKIGDIIYYEYNFVIKQSRIINRDHTYKMPNLVLENGDTLPINQYYYTDEEDLKEVVSDLKKQCENYIQVIEKDIVLLKAKKLELEKKLKNLDEFVNPDMCYEEFFDCSLEDYKNIVGKCFRHGNVVLKVVGIRDDFSNPHYEDCNYKTNFLYEEFRNSRDGWNINEYIWLQDRAYSMYIDEEDKQKYLKFCITPYTEMNISKEGMYLLGKDGKLYVDDDCSGECYTCFEEMDPGEFERIRQEAIKNFYIPLNL